MRSIFAKSNKAKPRRLRRLFCRLFAAMLPRYGRRAVFLTTLFVHIGKLSPAHSRLLEDLNQKMDIAKDRRTLNLPMGMCNTIWQGRELKMRRHTNHALTEQELDEIADRAIRSQPEWAHYGTPERVREETCQVLRHSLMARDTRAA